MANRVILLMGQPIQNEDAAAAEAITPGQLVALNGSGLVIKQATASIATSRTFAMERDEMGNDIDTDYAIGDTVKVGAFHQGERVLGFIASGQNISVGDMLESAGGGNLKVFGSGVVLAKALESVNNTAGPGAARIRLEIV
jgi:hypothetical protein